MPGSWKANYLPLAFYWGRKGHNLGPNEKLEGTLLLVVLCLNCQLLDGVKNSILTGWPAARAPIHLEFRSIKFEVTLF